MISQAPTDIILYEFRDNFAQAVCSDRHDFVALTTVPSTFPRFLGANAAQAFPSKFDAGGAANKARSKIAITLARPCNSEIALNGPFSAHGEIHTNMRQLPAEFRRRHPAERCDGQVGVLSFRCRQPAGERRGVGCA
jgi:hypothetical protein